MSDEKRPPVMLSVDIEPEGLRQVVEEGRLTEFVETFSKLASEHIKQQVVEQLASAGVDASKVGRGINIDLGFTLDREYGTVPWPPWPPRVTLDLEDLRQIVREEVVRMR